jgi:hypothetical protein
MTEATMKKAEAFALSVGKLIQTFGAIEWYSYEWLKLLQRPEFPDWRLLRGTKLSLRVKAIKTRLHAAPIPDDLRGRSAAMWDDALSLGALRNTVAHSPVIGTGRFDQPDAMGVLNMSPKDESRDFELLGAAEIDAMTQKCSDLLRLRLQGLHIAVRARVLGSSTGADTG